MGYGSRYNQLDQGPVEGATPEELWAYNELLKARESGSYNPDKLTGMTSKEMRGAGAGIGAQVDPSGFMGELRGIKADADAAKYNAVSSNGVPLSGNGMSLRDSQSMNAIEIARRKLGLKSK